MGDETLDFLLEEQIENINVKSIGQILKNASEKYGTLGDEFKKNLVSSYIIFA